MLKHFHFTQPKYLFNSNLEGCCIVGKGGHLQYRQFWSQSDPYFLCHRNHPWTCPFRIYMVCGVYLSQFWRKMRTYIHTYMPNLYIEIWWNLISNDLLVAQDLWREKEARKSVKIMYAMHRWQHLHLPATGAKVSMKSQAYSQAVRHAESSMCSINRVPC